jgi:hypothetical protein
MIPLEVKSVDRELDCAAVSLDSTVTAGALAVSYIFRIEDFDIVDHLISSFRFFNQR